MSTLPPLAAMRSFEALARLGSVTLAASELHVTHSAISQQIRLLEEFVGVPLVYREGRSVRLNHDGRQYALQLRSGLAELGEATRLVRARPREGEIVVTLLPSFGQHWLLPRLARFYAAHPDYRVHLRAGLDVQDLRQGLVDIGVRMGDGSWENVHKEKLFQDEEVIVAAPHFNGGNLPRTPQAIMAAPLITTGEPWLGWCQAAGVAVPAKPFLVINDSNLKLAAVHQGMGITLTRRSIVQNALDDGSLLQLSPIVTPYPFPYWLIWPEREASRIKQQLFSHWLREEVANYLAGLQNSSPPPSGI